MNSRFYQKVEKNPIIAAVNCVEKLEQAIQSPCEIVFLLTGNIFNLKDSIDKVKDADMDIYIHVDLMEGFSKDVMALKYIQENMRPDGIITTRVNLVKKAKTMNISTIQRLFLLDSLSVESGINSVRATRPDAIEIMPGSMPKVIKNIKPQTTNLPLIAGGLISDKEDVIECLKAGVIGISTSKEELWYI